MRALDHTRARPLGVAEFLWRHKGKILLVWAVGMVLTLAYLSLATRKFQSEAKLFVRLGRESVTLDPTATTGQIVSIAETRESEVYAVQELLTSRGLAENVVDQFGPEVILEKPGNSSPSSIKKWLSRLEPFNLNPLRVYSLRDKALKAFKKNLRVSAANKTSVVTLAYDAEDPKFAQAVLESLLVVARDEHLKAHRTKGSQEFFVEQSVMLKEHLAELERQLRDLKSTTGLASLTTQRELELERMASMEADLVRAKAELDSAEAEVAHRQRGLSDTPAMVVTQRATGLPQTASQTLREKLYDLEVKEQELAAKFTDKHPQLAQIREQLSQARAVVEDEETPEQVTVGINEAHQAAELAVQERRASVASLSARSQALETAVASARSELKNLNDSELEIVRLEREIELAQANYRKYAENLEEARINQELEVAKISSLNIMQPPSFSETPISPQPLITLAVGFVLSSLGGLGMALFAHGRASHSMSVPMAGSNGSTTHTLPSLTADLAWRNEVAPTNPR